MHHPLKDLTECSSDDADNADDAMSETSVATTTVIDDDASFTTQTRRSCQSLDSEASLPQLDDTAQPKAVHLRFIRKPDLPTDWSLHLVQELFARFPVFCVSSSPDGQYLAVAGGDQLEDSVQNGGLLQIFPLRRRKPDGLDDPSPGRPFSLYNAEASVLCSVKHGAILDVAWTLGRPGFLFTAGMDKHVNLWNVSLPGFPIVAFPHPDVVSSLAVHPKDDRLFVSGCIDCRLRLWSVEAAKVVASVDLPHPITAVCFSWGGQSVVAGTASGHLYVCDFDESGALKYHSQIHVRSRRGKNAAGAAKVSGLKAVDGPNREPMILVTTNDSRIRLYRLRDREVKVKFHGIINEDSQLQAVIQGRIVCCASEDGRVGLWRVPDLSKSILQSISERLRGRVLVDSLVSFRAVIGKVSESEEQLQPGQPLSTAILLPDCVYGMLVAADVRPLLDDPAGRPVYIVTGDMTGRVKIFEWGGVPGACDHNKD